MRVFIAGPYNDFAPEDIIDQNIERAVGIAQELMRQGHQVYCPHAMTGDWEHVPGIDREMFLALHSSFIEHWAEAILRLPGDSPGADAEMKLAAGLGLRIFPYPTKKMQWSTTDS